MTLDNALIILGSIGTACGIIIGALIISIQLIAGRRSRRYDILHAAHLDLKLREIVSEALTEKKDKSEFAAIRDQEGFIKAAMIELQRKPLSISFCSKHVSLDVVCYSLFLITILIFIISVSYMAAIASCADLLRDCAVYTIIVLASVDFVLLLPVCYWTTTKQHTLP
jgi:hypothetical protein